MPYNKAPQDHTEFGGGPGLIDPVMRKDRNITGPEALMEIYATDPTDAASDPATVDLETRAARTNRVPKNLRIGTN